MIDFPTRGDNILDIVITNRPSLVNRSCGLPALSDHDVIFIDITTRAMWRKPVRRQILLWKKANFDSIHSRLKEWSSDFAEKYSSTTPVDDLADAIQHELEQVIKD